MKKVFKTLFVLLVIVLVFYVLGRMEIIQLRWVTADMGWCQNHALGLKIGETEVFKLADRGFSDCV